MNNPPYPGFAKFVEPDISERMDCVKVWTDGSGSRKENAGGWAFIAEFMGTVLEHYGHLDGATSNEAELTAIVQALQFLRVSTHPLIIHTDSEYARNCFTKWGPLWMSRGEWTNSLGLPVANQPVIERGLILIKHHERRRPVFIRHVKGHSGIPQNERADLLAGIARKSKINSLP